MTRATPDSPTNMKADQSQYQGTARRWLASNLDDVHTGYIQNRLKRYDQVLDQITVNRILDAKLQALVIWNHGLFFEVHEHNKRKRQLFCALVV